MERPNGTESYGYGLIDVETASMVGSYETEEAALRDVADDARRYGPDAPELLSLALYREGPPGESGAIASGAELVKRALAFSEAKSESATVGASSHREPKAQVGDYTFLGGRSTLLLGANANRKDRPTMATEVQSPAPAPTPAQPAKRPPLPTLNPASLKASLEEIKARRGPAPWNEILVRNDRITVTVICQPPGHKNDHHYHLQDEWWIIAEGQLAWEMEGHPEPIYVQAGDFVFAPANHYHLIHVLGDTQAIRIGVSYTGEGHRHNRQDPPEPPVRGHV